MKRIRGEIPQFKRCCICLPLRHGLIAWGYIRLVICVVILVGLTDNFFKLIEISKNESGYEVYVALYGALVIVGGVEIVLNVVFVYAGHKKDQKMLRVYYIYSFILWIVIIIWSVSLSGYAMYLMSLYPISLTQFCYVLFYVLAQIVVQSYVLLLVRSEYMKLRRDCDFKFVKNAAESVCKMNYEENISANEDITADEIITANRNVISNGVNGVDENETNISTGAIIY